MNSISRSLRAASLVPAKSTCTEWSITKSTGTSGSTVFGLFPSRAAAERMAARSTSNGTPVKSCSRMRATTNGISVVRSARGRDPAKSRTFCCNLLSVAVPEDGFEHNAQRNREPLQIAQPRRASAGSE